MKRNYAIYHVAFKILLKKYNKVLFLKTADGRYWDLPGGRIDNNEKKVPLEKILAREIKEEIGKNIKYQLGKPIFQYRRFHEKIKFPIFITVYEGKYLSGKIKLSFEHSNYCWLIPQSHRFKGKGFCYKEEYLTFKKYFKLRR